MSFISDYMTYVERDEAHPTYHFWACLVALASLAGRKLWVKRPYQKVYANLYVVLVGPQGNRKTAARDICQTILKDSQGIVFASEATTREGLIKEMVDNARPYIVNGVEDIYCPMTILATELKEFLAFDPGRMINFLTAVYDRDFFDYSVRGRPEKDILNNPYVNILACETPDWLSDRLKERIVSGGFSRRVVYIYQTSHSRVVDTVLSPKALAARTRLIHDAQRIKELAGEMTFSPDCRKFYDNWYLSLKETKEPCLVGFYESKHTLATKVASLISISESSNRVIEVSHFEGALRVIDDAEVNMVRVFAGSGRNELSNVATKALDVIEKAGGPVAEKRVLVHLFSDCRNSREMDDVIAHLVRTGKILRYPKGDRFVLCSIAHVPKDDLEQLQRAVASKSGSIASSGQPAQPSLVADLTRELQTEESKQSIVPSASHEQTPLDVAEPEKPKQPSPVPQVSLASQSSSGLLDTSFSVPLPPQK